MASHLEKAAVVIDFGSAFVRCGFAGENAPRHSLTSPLARRYSYPCNISSCDEGTKMDWVEEMSELFTSIYNNYLLCRPRDRKVVLCESMVMPATLREAVACVLFDYLQAPALCICPGPSVALYATGVMTGIVLDVGNYDAHVLAVYGGVMLTGSYEVQPLGCAAIRRQLKSVLEEEQEEHNGYEDAGDETHDGMEVEDAEGENVVMEKCQLTDNELDSVVVRACLFPVRGVPAPQQIVPMQFLFSGNRGVNIDAEVRASVAAQAIFDGDEEGRSLAKMVLNCLWRCSRDTRKALAHQVLVTGGGGMLPGLCGRLQEEITKLAIGAGDGGDASEGEGGGEAGKYAWAIPVLKTGGGAGLKVVTSPCPRSLLVWQGASLFASLEGGSASRYLSSQQYLKHRKVPDWMSVSCVDWLFNAPQLVAG